jgi:hypothetical protein
MRKLQIGKWYYLKHWDHSQASAFDRVELEICGLVEDSDKTHVDLIYWNAISRNGDTELEHDAAERCQIALSNIIKAIKLPI